MRTPLIVGRLQDSGTRRTVYGNYGSRNHHKHNPHKLHNLPVLKRVADRVLETLKKSVVGGVGSSCTILDIAEILSYDHTPQHLHRNAPPYTVPDGTLIFNRLIMLTHNHNAEEGSHFLFVPSSSSWSPDPWVGAGCAVQEVHCLFFLMPFMFTGVGHSKGLDHLCDPSSPHGIFCN